MSSDEPHAEFTFTDQSGAIAGWSRSQGAVPASMSVREEGDGTGGKIGHDPSLNVGANRIRLS